jgi:glutamate synthase (NADPH/NADH) large chain
LRHSLNEDISTKEASKRYIKALDKGMLKVMSKMGISTYQSYCGAQIFDSIGLDHSVIYKYFTGTNCKIGGMTLKEISIETLNRHRDAFDSPEI